jgi:hypothetical protein
MRIIFSEVKFSYEERERGGIAAAHTKSLSSLLGITSGDRIPNERSRD